MQTLTITAPDDWHLHFRDGEFLKETVPATARQFCRAVVMPNLVPPITNTEQALAYRDRIIAASPNSNFEPIMTLYLTNTSSVDDIKKAVKNGIKAAKLYPAGATTNSDAAVSGIESLYPIFECMSEHGMLLLIHGEVTDSDVDIFDREKLFIDHYLSAIHSKFPELKIVFEHITTADAVEFVLSGSDNLASTITPQHLLFNRNDLLVGGIKPHYYCLPILKRNTHQARLREAVVSGSNKFFLGTDSAPHTQTTKEAACGCAGCYSAPNAIELYAQAFDELDALDKLEGFASFYGADFYGLKRNAHTLTLKKQAWTMPDSITIHDQQSIIPLFAGEQLNWQIV